MFDGMRIVVAGGAGMLGSVMCPKLLDSGAEVICVDNLVTGSAENVKRLLGREGFSFLECDVSAGAPVAGPIDAVVNLASPASPADFRTLALQILTVGSRGVENLLDLAWRNDARFLQASTSEVYGDPLVHPQVETYWGNVNPIGLRSVYDESKRFAEALTCAYHRERGVDVRIARIFNTYGPGMRPDDGRLVSNFVTQALAGRPVTIHGDGAQTRSLCFVDDEVDGLLALLACDHRSPVNIGNDHETTVLSVAELVLKLTDSDSEIVFVERPPDDPSRRCPDLSVARRVLGWEPTTPLRTGMEKTIDWFRRLAA